MKASAFGDLRNRRVALIGMPGTGKTTLLGELAREHSPRVVALDPVTNAPLAGMMGSRVRVTSWPMEGLTAAQVVASIRTSWSEGRSVGFDLSGLAPSARRAFADDLARELRTGVRDCLVILDEAHELVPQRGQRCEEVVSLISQGRNARIGVVLSAHRIARVDKDAVELSDRFVLMRVAGANDLAAVRRYIEAHLGDVDAYMATVPKLGLGQFIDLDVATPPANK